MPGRRDELVGALGVGWVGVCGEELEEEAAALRGRGVADMVYDVDAAGADEGGVEALEVVGGHEEHALLARGHLPTREGARARAR